MNMRILSACFLTALMFLTLIAQPAQAAETTCAVYFTGVGCPHCARTDPVLLEQITAEYPDIVFIEYEIYQQQENAPLMYIYDSVYGSGLGVPLLIFNNNISIAGDLPILTNIESLLATQQGNPCLLIGGTESFEILDIASLPGGPKIWRGGRILISVGGGGDSELLREVLSSNITEALEGEEYTITDAEAVALSGKNVEFEHAIIIGGWKFQWNGEAVEGACSQCPEPEEWSACVEGNRTRTNYRCSEETGFECIPFTETQNCDQDGVSHELTLTKILSLAVVDAVNPCAIAVLTLMLIAIITYNPEKRRNVLYAGLAFTAAVYILYMVYGLVIIRFFQLVQSLTAIRLMLYQILGVAAIILGLFNIKDFFRYKPGGALTEMPMGLRPKVKKIIEGIVSPKGAFVVGALVTIFLLPCTIGPYVIAGGILSALEMLQTIPWLLLYNLVFVAPMLIITAAVYLGFTTVENVSGWKEKNIRYLHLIAGTVMVLLGIAMFFLLI